MADYLANRKLVNRLASSYHSATDDIEGRNVPLDLADLQAELRIDEVDRTMANPDHNAGSSDRVTTNGQSAG